jgi:hypothetical protein
VARRPLEREWVYLDGGRRTTQLMRDSLGIRPEHLTSRPESLFTYLRQPRRLRIIGDKTPTFPSPVAITFQLAPGQVFGANEGPIRAVRLGSAYQMEWNANTDRSHSYPQPGFTRLQLKLPALGGAFEVDGDKVTFRIDVTTSDQLVRYLQLLTFALPASLSALLPEPVYITSIDGAIGDVGFRVEHTQSTTPVIVLDDDKLAERVSTALSQVELLSQESGMRLLAATRYIHTAGRLLAAGYSPWEFMAEALLNYSKSLEVLFGDSRDDQRAGMRSLALAETDIEARFIPVTLLRDFLDVGHPKLALVDGSRLKGLYLFLVGLEVDFHDLLAKVRNAMTSGTWTPPLVTSTVLKPADLKTLDRIITADELHRQAKSPEPDA